MIYPIHYRYFSYSRNGFGSSPTNHFAFSRIPLGRK